MLPTAHAGGYSGDARAIDSFRIGALELVWSAACVVLAAAVLGVDRVVR